MTFSGRAILAVLMSVTLPTTMASGRVCPPKKCDFNSLLANVYLTNATQAQRLLTDCGLTVSAVKGTTIQKVNVFDSSRPTTSNPNNDPDLGTPNRDCPGGGPGIGNGGKPSSPWPNCVSQGNLIIIQDPNKPPGLANDNQYGGCITFEFTNPVQMVDMGILDLDEQGTTVKLTNAANTLIGPFTDPGNVGNNGFWPVSATTTGFSGAQHIKKIEVCLPGSGAVTSLEYRECGSSGGGSGDPHILLWNSTQYSYHGACDLVLLDNKDFAHGLGMDIHIRTTHEAFYSYIEQTAIRIGSDILEFAGDDFYINGVQGSDSDLPTAVGGFRLKPPTYTESGMAKHYVLDLNKGDYFHFFKYKKFMGVEVHGKSEDFGTSVGLLGDYYFSKMLARDGVTILNDVEEFGAEWQVRGDEPKLFRTLREPQHPHAMCKPVSPVEVARASRRRLREDGKFIKAAEAACAGKSKNDFDFCVQDVLATKDLGMVGATW